MSDSMEKAGESIAVASEYTLITDDADFGIERDSDAGPDAGSSSDMAEGDEMDAPTAWSLIRELLETIVLALVIFLVVRQGVQNYRIESHSMEPNFYEGQFVLVNKLAYKLGEPSRGDVVVFRNPNNKAEDYIKRVIGLPGDTITFQNGETYVNRQVVDDSFTNQPTQASGGPIVVGQDYIFVMGDNRPNSRDSRVFGPIEDDLLVGKAWLRVWPFSTIGLIDHLDLEPGVPLSTGTAAGEQ